MQGILSESTDIVKELVNMPAEKFMHSFTDIYILINHWDPIF